MRNLALLLALVAGAALAGVTPTEVHDTTVLTPAGGKSTTLHDNANGTALAQCRAAGVALGPNAKYTCTDVYGFTNVPDCADVPAPTIALVQVTRDGSTFWELPDEGALTPPEPTQANSWAVMRWVYVHNPSWPAGAPVCWVRGWAPEQTWRFNPNSPNTPVMEMIVPNMPPIAEAPNSIEPFPASPEFDKEWHSASAEAFRHESCYCYSDDQTPCPPNCPPNVPSACGPITSVACGGPG